MSDLWAAYQAINEEIEEKTPAEEIAEKLEYHGQGFKLVEIPIDSDSDSDDEETTVYQMNYAQQSDTESIKPIRSAHEIPTEQILPNDIAEIPTSIPDDAKIIPCCVVVGSVGDLCICDSIGNPVAPGSLLVNKDREPITRVIEVFGQVEHPKIILHGNYDIGMELYAALNDAVVIDQREMTRIEKTYKGTDSSNKFDEPNERPDDDDDGVVADSDSEDILIGYQR